MYIKLFQMKSVFKLMLEALIGKPAVGSGGSLFDFVFLFFVLRWGCFFFFWFVCFVCFLLGHVCVLFFFVFLWWSEKEMAQSEEKVVKRKPQHADCQMRGYVDYVPVTCLDYKAKRLSCEDPFRCLLVWPLRGLGETMWINSGGAPQCWTSLDFSPGK